MQIVMCDYRLGLEIYTFVLSNKFVRYEKITSVRRLLQTVIVQKVHSKAM
jgi:hypothetical protein